MNVDYEIVEASYNHPIFNLVKPEYKFSVVSDRVHLEFFKCKEDAEEWIKVKKQ